MSSPAREARAGSDPPLKPPPPAPKGGDAGGAREKHFFDVYSPEYNILNIPGSPSRGSG